MNSPVALGTAEPGTAGGSIRLNLGGRDTCIPGFLTVDLKEGGDIRTDVSDLSQFGDHTVEEIYASHVLEHFAHVRTVSVLKEWHRVLKPGGKLFISVPDFEAIVKLYEVCGHLNDFIRNLLYGDQGYDLAFHYTIFTFTTLAAYCAKAGFEDVQRIARMPYALRDCSTNVDNMTFQPISVNVEAIA